MSPWVWVVAAYGCAAALVGGYVAWVRRRLRELGAAEEVEA